MAKGTRLAKAKGQIGLKLKAQGEAKAKASSIVIPSYYTLHTHMIVTIINQDGRR